MGRKKKVKHLERYEVFERRDEPVVLGALTSEQASVLASALDERARRAPVLHRGEDLAAELLLVERARAALSLGMRSPGPDVPLGTQGLLLVFTMVIATEVYFSSALSPSGQEALVGLHRCLDAGLKAAGYEFV
jgi:hypothetical protein